MVKLNETTVVSASDDNTLRVWDLTNDASRVLRGHTDYVNSVIKLNETMIVSASADGTLRCGVRRSFINTIDNHAVHFFLKKHEDRDVWVQAHTRLQLVLLSSKLGVQIYRVQTFLRLEKKHTNMNADPKINRLIKQIKACTRVEDELYQYVCKEFRTWVKRRREDFEDILLDDGWWYYYKDYMFYHSLYRNSTCLRALHQQTTIEVDCGKGGMECTGKLLRRWYNLRDQQRSKEKRIVHEESHNNNSYFYALSSDIIKLVFQFL